MNVSFFNPGQIADVDNTPFDFRNASTIRNRMKDVLVSFFPMDRQGDMKHAARYASGTLRYMNNYLTAMFLEHLTTPIIPVSNKNIDFKVMFFYCSKDIFLLRHPSDFRLLALLWLLKLLFFSMSCSFKHRWWGFNNKEANIIHIFIPSDFQMVYHLSKSQFWY